MQAEAAILAPGRTLCHAPGTSKKRLFETIARLISEDQPSLPYDDVLDHLIAREKLGSTGLGGGIAIPHPRTPLKYLEQPMVAACFLKNPVNYHALDKQPVSTLFFILFPELKFHLHLLSSISLCLRNRQFSEFLKTCPEQSELIEKNDVFLVHDSLR